MNAEIKTGGHAFPHNVDDLFEPNTAGMTLRDYFAAQTLADLRGAGSPDQAAKWAYEVADAMLKAREVA